MGEALLGRPRPVRLAERGIGLAQLDLQVRALTPPRAVVATRAALRRGWWLVLGVGALCLLCGCSEDSRPPGDDPSGRASVATSAAATERPADPTLVPDTPLAQELWPPKPPRPGLTGLPAILRAADIASAPWLHESPVPSSVLAAGMSLFGDAAALTPGTVSLLTTSEGWRRVSMGEAGVSRPGYAEQEFSLSPDGAVLALGDRNAVILLSLADASSRRYATPATEPVALTWSPDGEVLIYADRHRPQDGYRLSLADGSTSRTKFSAFTSWPGAADEALEFRARNGSVSTLRLWLDLDRHETVTLAQTIRSDGPPVWSERAAFAQRYRTLEAGPAITGVVTLDPQTGAFDAVLPLTRQQLRWGEVLGWADTETLVIDVGDGRGGRLVSWTPNSETLVELSAYDTRGMMLSVALGLLE